MKYKILKGTETFEKLTALYKEMERVRDAVDPILKEYGTDRYISTQGELVGGIHALELKTKPEGFKVIGKPWQRLYAPKASNTKEYKRFCALPTLPFSALNDILGFKGGALMDGGGLSWVNCPGIEFHDKHVLLDLPNKCKYTAPNADIVEIFESEYVRLSEEKKVKSK